MGLHNQPHSITTGNCIFREIISVAFVPSLECIHVAMLAVMDIEQSNINE